MRVYVKRKIFSMMSCVHILTCLSKMEFFSCMSWLILAFAFISDSGEAACENITINSYSFRYNRKTVPGAARIMSLLLLERYSISQCVQGLGFFFFGPDIWVNLGCRGVFDVTYIPGDSTEITCSSVDFKPVECHVGSVIVSAVVKTHLSIPPCVHGVSFDFAGSTLTVRNGCGGRFVVGYLN